MNESQETTGLFSFKEVGRAAGYAVGTFVDPNGEPIESAACKACAKTTLSQLIGDGTIPADQESSLAEQIDATSMHPNCGMRGRYTRDPLSALFGSGGLGFGSLASIPAIATASQLTGVPSYQILLDSYRSTSGDDLIRRIMARIKFSLKFDDTDGLPSCTLQFANGRELSGRVFSKKAAREQVEGVTLIPLDDGQKRALLEQIESSALPEEDPAPVFTFKKPEGSFFPFPHGRVSNQLGQGYDVDFMSLAELRTFLEAAASSGGFPADQTEKVVGEAVAAGLPEHMTEEEMERKLSGMGIPVIEIRMSVGAPPREEPDPAGKHSFRRCTVNEGFLHGYFYDPEGRRITSAIKSKEEALRVLDKGISRKRIPGDDRDKILAEIDYVFAEGGEQPPAA